MMLSCAQINKLLYSTAGELTTVAPATCSAPHSLGAASSGAGSETRSEISSADSDWSDIRAIALKLGVANPDDLHTERFKVDRQKLEQMLKESSLVDGMNGAEYFFESVMKFTETHISWPCRLKIGAKSKKDPHVRIVGRIEEVQNAKERVLANLDSRGTRVIMKMDVSYTDHSYIIGRGGNNIKRIMEDTATHIHFPDSNRSNPTEKSNQVSLCGSLEGVESARALVRLSTPLLISFELPILAPGRPQPDHETPYVKLVETKYNVQVIFSSRPKLHSSLVLVKGSEKEATKVQDATQLLINFSCENIANQILVQMQLEISPQHHEIVKGKNNSNLLGIMERTRTKIIFPDLSDLNVKPLKKSQVTITGTIDGVYKARQQLLGNLPIALIFDFPDNQNNASEIIGLSTKYGVYISLRQKQRQSTLAIVVKGVEKFIDKIYEARQEILRLSTPLIKATIPESYFAPRDKEMNIGFRTMLTSLLAGYPDSPKTPGLLTAHLQMSPYGSNGQTLNNNHLLITNNNNNNSNISNNNDNNNNHSKSYPPGFGACTSSNICPPTQKYVAMHNNSFSCQQPNHNNNYLQITSTNVALQRTPQTAVHQQQQVSPRNSCHNTSGYQSFSSSSTSLEQVYPPYGGGGGGGSGTGVVGNRVMAPNAGVGEMNSRGQYSPDTTFSSELGCGRVGRRSSDGVLLGLGASGPLGGPMMPSSAESYRSLQYDLKQNRIFDFDMKRAMGFKAMDRPPVSGELRTPTPNWAGMALSRTSPGILESVDDNMWPRNLNGLNFNGNVGANGPPISPYALGVTVGLLDATPTNRRLNLPQHKDIHTLLTSLGLEHYIKTFVTNEIDLEMFTTLNEDNLLELGITAFGARRKLLLAINALQASEATNAGMPIVTAPQANSSSPRFSGSAAPGAERRPSNQW
ncbi:protein bicaudal C [Anastrepha ludens]|uniref:protein bicaudal C n=1 Tax=Anastrepha ludens TaxID=28586 RepID=UPI0023B0E759|nr:protein bicaudal C [Anastrepha ludens]XP_053958138.1 protein bicaudal C [Anastrepha ludens]XP_053958140.1 protein bicaudal C [Anastrepha ludens]